MTKYPVRPWTEFDDGLLSSMWIINGLLSSRADQLEYVNPPFAIDYVGGERVYTFAPFELLEWAAPGDGTYRHDSSFFFATGRGGLSMTAAAAVIRSRGNARRRTEASRNAIPRWLLADRGTVWVSSHGFWIQSMRGLFPWPWESVQGMQVLNQGTLQIQGDSAGGPVNWQVVSPAAELIFALWVLGRRVPHPQWMDRSWIPANWLRWAAEQGKSLPFAEPGDISLASDTLD